MQAEKQMVVNERELVATGRNRVGNWEEVCDLGEKRWELEEKRVKVGKDEWELRRKRMESGRKRGKSWEKMGRKLLGKMFVKMGGKSENWKKKGLRIDI